MSENLWLYNKYRTVPEEALKAFNNGTFKGTDINTMWRIKCLTDEFGPCGIGWYYDILRLWEVSGENNELMCFAEIKLYYKKDGEWSKGVPASGGSKLISYVKNGDYYKNSDEGYKMALTDALGVACKLLGFGADTYWDNDKTKYTVMDDDNRNVQADKKQPKKTDKNSQKTNKNDKDNKFLTKAEMIEIWGVLDVEKTIKYYEDQLGVSYLDWDEVDCEAVTDALRNQKAKREAAKRKSTLEKIGDDIPFPMGDE